MSDLPYEPCQPMYGSCALLPGHHSPHHGYPEDIRAILALPRPEADRPTGAWMVYDYDYGPYVISLHASAEEAARAAAKQGYGRVGYWAYGTQLRQAVEEWEGR